MVGIKKGRVGVETHAGKPALQRTTIVRWNEISAVGMPPLELRTCPTGAPRGFLCRGGYSIFCSFMFDDGSGFMDEQDDPVEAWAVIEGF